MIFALLMLMLMLMMMMITLLLLPVILITIVVVVGRLIWRVRRVVMLLKGVTTAMVLTATT